MTERIKHPPAEKKVEYLELIYDLIFVYIIGRNNALLHHTENGRITAGLFLAYFVCTLAVIQIWNFSTFYINLYGRNGVRDHIFLFLNMYLLYYIADGISVGWETTFFRFNIAWMLILVNIGVQHIIELKNHRQEAVESRQLRRKAAILLAEAALVGVHMAVYRFTGVSIAYIPILFGIGATVLSGRLNARNPVEFAHLSERAMLYVVFTFGEMIISIATYFTGDMQLSGLYFSAMAFLIVVGLFLSYGTLYNKIINREAVTNGTGYMMIHVFLIFALNNISVSLEFMHDAAVDNLQKTIFLVGSFLLYFSFMFMTMKYARKKCALRKGFVTVLCAAGVCFAALMLIFRRMMYVNIAITVIFIYGIFLLIYRRGKE
ncbi:MAG: low temperature requirement protein A [Oscillospiraceae bacterium]|nr:low temperature requirement protein A [Oscillospiraceae bacterium]